MLHPSRLHLLLVIFGAMLAAVLPAKAGDPVAAAGTRAAPAAHPARTPGYGGDLEVYCLTPPDRGQHEESSLRYRVAINGRKYPATPIGANGGLKTCRGVTLHGTWQGGRFLLESVEANSPTPFSSALARGVSGAGPDSFQATGTRSVLLMLVDFDDAPGAPATPEETAAETASLSAFLNATSLRQLSLACTTTPTLRMPHPAHLYTDNEDPYTADTLLSDARSAATTAGYDPSEFDFDIVLFRGIGFGWSGLGFIGGKGAWVQAGGGTGWWPTAAHELGHNLGLFHAKAWDPDGADPLGAGQSVEYGNPFDTMGSGAPPAACFNGQFQFVLGWLGAEDLAVAQSSGIYRITRIDSGLPKIPGQRYALKIPAAKSWLGLTLDYWIDYRRLFPSRLPTHNGVNLQLGDELGADGGSYLLDLAPETAPLEDAGLEIGRTFTDPAATVCLTPIAHHPAGPGAEAIDLAVWLGPAPGNLPPVGTLSGPAEARVWQPVSWEVRAHDPNGDALAYHWNLRDGTPSVNAPRQTGYYTGGGEGTTTVTLSDMKGGATPLPGEVHIHDPLEHWSRVRDTEGGHTNAYHVGGQFRVLHLDTLSSSPDGVQWSTTTIGQPRSDGWTGNQYLLDLQEGGGLFVAVGFDFDPQTADWTGHIQTSPDLQTWTARHPMVNEELRSCAHRQSVWVAVGDRGTITTSTDAGQHWNPAASGVTADLTHVVAVEAGFLACLRESRLLYSTDGLNWSAIPIPPTYGGEFALPLGDGRILVNCAYQSLLLEWPAGQIPAVVASAAQNQYLRGCRQEHGLLYAVGERWDGERWAPFLYRSRDGLAWLEIAAPDGLPTPGRLAGDGRRLLAAGAGQVFLSDPLYDARDRWLIDHFPGEERFDAARCGPNSDPDEDGCSNLLEFALGTPPRSADPSGGPVTDFLAVPDGLGGETFHLLFSYRRRVDAALLGLTYLPELSADLVHWKGDPAQWQLLSETDHGDGFATVLLQSLSPLLPGQPCAARLRVADAP